MTCSTERQLRVAEVNVGKKTVAADTGDPDTVRSTNGATNR
jgi:hypothetical protein